MAKFVGNRDFEFFQHVNRELSAEIVDTPVILYKLNLNYVNTNIYGESVEKVAYDGVELTAFVDYKGSSGYVQFDASSSGNFSLDIIASDTTFTIGPYPMTPQGRYTAVIYDYSHIVKGNVFTDD